MKIVMVNLDLRWLWPLISDGKERILAYLYYHPFIAHLLETRGRKTVER